MTAVVRHAFPAVWAVVPAKAFDRAKCRLQFWLTPSERSQLAEAMLRDVLHTLSQVDDLAGVMVVTSDPVVSALATEFGAIVLHDVLDIGTNAAVKQAMRQLTNYWHGGALIVPGDVPFITTQEVRTVLTALSAHSLTIVPDRSYTGTNMLAGRNPFPIETCFGAGSFERHLENACRMHVKPAILDLAGFRWDIDLPSDLFPNPGLELRSPDGHTPQLLHSLRSSIKVNMESDRCGAGTTLLTKCRHNLI